ncbi:MAG: glycosyltransferase family 4 protein, partial [Anaerolineaceae bacterium]|nr:glycosyltransferase family 4 protein [Anaerolineaceae bacterium]
GTQSTLVRPENGWLLPPGDLNALAVTMQQALADLPRLRRMGAASYEIVQNEVNLETMVAAFEAAVTFVMAR